VDAQHAHKEIKMNIEKLVYIGKYDDGIPDGTRHIYTGKSEDGFVVQFLGASRDILHEATFTSAKSASESYRFFDDSGSWFIASPD
jgi:hypothetical protein